MKERKWEAGNLNHGLGPLEEHKGPWGRLVKPAGLRKEPGFRVDPCSLRRTQRPTGSQGPELRLAGRGRTAGVRGRRGGQAPPVLGTHSEAGPLHVLSSHPHRPMRWVCSSQLHLLDELRETRPTKGWHWDVSPGLSGHEGPAVPTLPHFLNWLDLNWQDF